MSIFQQLDNDTIVGLARATAKLLRESLLDELADRLEAAERIEIEEAELREMEDETQST